MKINRLLVVGGVAAGPKAAARARRLDPEVEITIVERGEHISYAACGLPYFLSGSVNDSRVLLARSPEEFKKRQNIKVLTRHLVESIDPPGRTAEVRSLAEGRRFSLRYDRMVIATGAGALIPPIPGVDLEGVFTLRTYADGLALKDYIEGKSPRRAVVAGGGAVGLEAVEALAALGMKVCLVEMADRILPSLDEDLAGKVSAHLRDKGVEVHLGSGIARIDGKNGRIRSVATKKEEIAADLLLLAAGIRPETELARRAGVVIGPTGAIRVDERMETSLPGVFAAGDCVELKHLVSGAPVWAPLGSTANKTGRVAGENALGGSATFEGVLGTLILKVFDLTAARTGLGAREVKEAGLDSFPTVIFDSSHPHYYPGGEGYVLKIEAANKDGRLLGAQAVGGTGVDKRIDTLGAAIRFGADLGGLAELDLAYAPPYSPALDGIITAAYVAASKRTQGIRSVDAGRLKEMRSSGAEKVQLVDIRSPEERKEGVIPGSVSLTPRELIGSGGDLDPGLPTVVYCGQGIRSLRAAAALKKAGWAKVFDLAGGYRLWPD